MNRPYIQRGRGLGTFISSMWKTTAPFLKNIGSSLVKSPLVKDVGKSLKDTAITSGLEMAADALSGKKTPRESLGATVQAAKSNIATVMKSRAKENRKELKRNGASKKRRKLLKKSTIFDEEDSGEDDLNYGSDY